MSTSVPLRNPKEPVVVIVSCRSDEDEDVLGWRLESLLPDDWEVVLEKDPPEDPEPPQDTPENA